MKLEGKVEMAKSGPLLFLLGILLSGCVGAGVEGARIAKDRSVVNAHMERARQGDAEAQYKVGEALCCSPREEVGAFYNTRHSVGWLCAAARQGHAKAMYKIGKIYSGDVVDGVRLIRRTAMGIAGSSENRPVAYIWFRQAAYRGITGAVERANALWKTFGPSERQVAARLMQAGLGTTCLWDDAIINRR